MSLALTSHVMRDAVSPYLSSLVVRLDASLCALVRNSPSCIAAHFKHLLVVHAVKDMPLLAKSLVNVQSLTINITHVVDDKAFAQFLCTVSATLRTFSLQFCGGLSATLVLRALATNCTRLQSVVLRFIPGVCAEDVELLVRRTAAQLTVLELDSCGGVNDDVLKAVARYCTNLEQLCVGGCADVGDEGVIAIAQSPCAQTLLALDIRSCMHITDEGVEQIAIHCKSLKYLNLWRVCVTSIGVRAVAEGLGERLKTLVIGDCIGIDDTALQSIADNCDTLDTLVMCGLKHITNLGVMSLFDCMRGGKLQLQTLTVDRCTSISDNSMLVAVGLLKLRCCAEISMERDYCISKDAASVSSDDWGYKTEVWDGSYSASVQEGSHMSQIRKLSALDTRISQTTWTRIRELRKIVELFVDEDAPCDTRSCTCNIPWEDNCTRCGSDTLKQNVAQRWDTAYTEAF